MAQKIPFFELFTALSLSWEQRMALDGAYLTGAELDREQRLMALDLTVRADLGEEKDAISEVIREAYDLSRVIIRQRVDAPVEQAKASGA